MFSIDFGEQTPASSNLDLYRANDIVFYFVVRIPYTKWYKLYGIFYVIITTEQEIMRQKLRTLKKM